MKNSSVFPGSGFDLWRGPANAPRVMSSSGTYPALVTPLRGGTLDAPAVKSDLARQGHRTSDFRLPLVLMSHTVKFPDALSLHV